MARCKMDKPERADYIRIFARHLLTDEDYEHLTRDEWGSVFLFILHQWTKGGSLPDDHAKLAGIARCTPKALADLLAKWPKLLPIDGQPGRVGIPYVVKEWEQVMGFYQAQSNRGKASAESRLNRKSTMVEPPMNHGATNQDQDQDQDQNQGKEKEPCTKPAKAASAPDLSPVIYQVPCKGLGAKTWPLTQAKMDEWAEAFPGIDLKAELRKAIQWLKDNHKNGKTAQGMPAYFGRWLGRAQDSTRPSTAQGATNGNGKTHHRTATDQAYIAQLAERDARRAAQPPPPPGPDDEELRHLF